jgi:triosephosphate isomerase
VRPLLAANWKMNPPTVDQAVELALRVAPVARRARPRVEVALLPPFVWLEPVAAALRDEGIGIGAQDCHWERSGAYTGEVSAAMLSGWCQWVICGHSERRGYFGETDEQVARKVRAALAVELSVILCVGEREEEMVAGRTEEVVTRQLRAALEGLDADLGRVVVAYEPVWAIGTGRNADPERAGATMALIRKMLAGWGAGEPRVLYGGSVNADNVTAYVGLSACAGCLVGGASLKAEEFSTMIERVARA